MVFSDDDLIDQWWEKEDDLKDDDYLIAAVVLLDERSKSKRCRSIPGKERVLRDIASGNSRIMEHLWAIHSAN
uniref:Uncharacterized protein n=1 Tax=Arundo donax TaxID=35708 RepID=A0A0A9C0W8_ARUDO